MSTRQLKLGFAALLASVSLASAAQAQVDLNDSNSSGVIVSLRSQNQLFVSQETTKAIQQRDEIATTQPAKESQAAEAKEAADREAARKEDSQADDKTKNDSGRLSPIAMESVRAPIGAANISVTDIGTKVLPDDQAAKQMVPRLPLPNGRDRAFEGLTYRWQAANICHLPLYFEEPMLERHGQQCCPTWIQPAVSGSKFLSNLILYPYKATLHPAFENRYTLGHFRPGSSAPCLRDTLPWSADAALVQAGAATAVFVGLPW